MNFEEKTKEEFDALSPEEQAKYLKDKAAADKAATKAKKDAEKGSDSAGLTEKHFQEQGAKSKANIANGGKEVVVSLTNKTMVRFTKDFGHMKENHKQEVSDLALAIYEKAGVVEKI